MKLDKIKLEVERIILDEPFAQNMPIETKEQYLNMLFQDMYADGFIERFIKLKKMGFPYKK